MKPVKLRRAYDRFAVPMLDRLRDPLLFFNRFTWGWMFFGTGKGKLGNLADTTEFFRSLGLPVPGVQAVFIGGLECVGGLLLIAGLFSRPVAMLLASTMVVAYLTADRAGFASLQAFTAATPFPFLMATLLVAAFGPGRIAVDHLLRRRCSAADRQATARLAGEHA
ncbi:MAG: DoxX family protein [Planctomycetota bacterium]